MLTVQGVTECAAAEFDIAHLTHADALDMESSPFMHACAQLGVTCIGVCKGVIDNGSPDSRAGSDERKSEAIAKATELSIHLMEDCTGFEAPGQHGKLCAASCIRRGCASLGLKHTALVVPIHATRSVAGACRSGCRSVLAQHGSIRDKVT